MARGFEKVGRHYDTRVYEGDLGAPALPKYIDEHVANSNVNTDELSYSELFAYALASGVPAKDLLGVDNCLKHVDKVNMDGKRLTDKYSLCMDVVYCNQCWQWFRNKVAVATDA